MEAPPPALPPLPPKKKESSLAAIGALCAIAAALLPLATSMFFLLFSLPLLLTAFVLAIMSLVRGRFTGGVILLIGVFFAFLGIAFIAVAILIVFWDDHRLLVALLLAALFTILGVVAGFAAWKQIAAKPRPFDASLSELGKDREQLKARS